MRKQIVNLSIHQSSKVLAILNFLIVFLYVIPLSLFFYFTSGDPSSFGFLFLPFITLIMSYIGYVIVLWLYNFVAGSFGGIEVELSDSEE